MCFDCTRSYDKIFLNALKNNKIGLKPDFYDFIESAEKRYIV